MDVLDALPFRVDFSYLNPEEKEYSDVYHNRWNYENLVDGS